MFAEDNCISTEYVDFFINKYLKVLETRWLKDLPWHTICRKLSEIGLNLEEVIFSNHYEWFPVICSLPNLKRVIFQHFCTDEFLRYLSIFCTHLETLDVRFSSKVSVAGLKHLCCKDGSKNSHSFHVPIKELLISSTAVGDEDIKYILKNMPSLETIDYWQLPEVLYHMHSSDITALHKVKPYNLTHLDFSLCHTSPISTFNDILAICIFLCPHVKSLSCLVLEKKHLDLCYQLQEVEKLDLDCWKEPSLELNELLALNGKNLTSLKLTNFSLSLSVLAQNCPHLNILLMDKVNLQHNVNDSVPIFHNLENVVLEKFTFINPVITEAVICLLSSCPNLNLLFFKRCKEFSSEIKTQILRCCEEFELHDIDLSGSDVEFVLLRDILFTCSTLKSLSFEQCPVTKNGEAVCELQTIAVSLPNNPQIYFEEEQSSCSDIDEFFMSEYDVLDTDEEDEDMDVDQLS